MAGILGSDFMDEAALLLNDSAKVTWTYAIQVPWFRRALNEFIDDLVKNSITLITSRITAAPTVIAAGTTTVSLPANGMMPIKLQERLTGSSFPYVEMTPLNDLPQGVTAGDSLSVWAWQGDMLNSVPVIKFIGATTSRDILMTYYLYAAPTVDNTTDFSTSLTFNTKRAISAKIAELINKFVLMNDKRARVLFDEYERARNDIIKIYVKIKQGNPVRKPRYSRGR